MAAAAAGSLALALAAALLLALAGANSEGDALSALRRSLRDPGGILQSWDPTLVNPCTWFHVTCDRDNRVTRLVPVLTTVLDKDLSEKTVMQNPEILLYYQAGRLLNPSTFAGWFGRSLYHAIVVFLITIHAYENEKSEMEELSMVALSGSIWLQAFVMTLEMNSFTFLQFLAIWGNFAAFYIINFFISSIPSAGMYTIMFRLCRQPSYWVTLLLITGVGMGPVLALKYFRYTYRPSAINILQKAERSCGPMYTLANLESQLRSENDNATNSILTTPVKNKSSVYEPLRSDSPLASRRSLATSSFDIFQPAQSRVPASYPRNIKTN